MHRNMREALRAMARERQEIAAPMPRECKPSGAAPDRRWHEKIAELLDAAAEAEEHNFENAIRVLRGEPVPFVERLFEQQESEG
jgi:hypothetical protein